MDRLADIVDMNALVASLTAIAAERAEGLPSRAEVEAIEARERRADNLERIKDAITSEDVEMLTADTQRDTYALRLARNWIDTVYGRRKSLRPVRLLALVGSKGLGKTVAAAWVLAREGGRYTTADEIARRFTSNHWRDHEWKDELLKCRFVIVDDVGTESRNEQALRPAMFELVNRRQGGRALTMLTGNITQADFEQRYDDRTIDRIKHVGVIVELSGESLRGKE